MPKGNGADNARDYLKGVIAGGGLWHALEVLDDAVLQSSVNTLNDVTLTSPNIGPNEWTDSQHTHASAATAGSTLGPGTTLSTPTLQTPAVSGVMTFGGDVYLQRIAPAQLQVQASVVADPGALHSRGSGAALVLTDRTLGTLYQHVLYRQADVLHLQQGSTDRATWNATGTLTLLPDSGQAALAWPNGQLSSQAPGGNPMVQSLGAQNLVLYGNGGYVHPPVDGFINLGAAGLKWLTVFAATGTINTSSRDAKEAITPLEPAVAMAAVRNTEAVTFDYRVPARPEGWYELPDDPEAAEQTLLFRLRNGPLEAAARHQAGFVAEEADELFLVGEGQTTPANSVGVLLGALHDVDARLSALEGA